MKPLLKHPVLSELYCYLLFEGEHVLVKHLFLNEWINILGYIGTNKLG